MERTTPRAFSLQVHGGKMLVAFNLCRGLWVQKRKSSERVNVFRPVLQFRRQAFDWRRAEVD